MRYQLLRDKKVTPKSGVPFGKKLSSKKVSQKVEHLLESESKSGVLFRKVSQKVEYLLEKKNCRQKR